VLKLALSLSLLVFASRAWCLAKGIEIDCSELGPGASQSYSQSFLVKNKFTTQLVVEVVASNPGTEDAPKCHLKWTVTSKLAGRSRILFRHEDDPEYRTNGFEFDGTSPDGSKLLLDFFTAAGDYTGHHAVVYDFVAGNWQIREVGDRATRNFPECDYFTIIQGVTDAGDVVLYVPKSIYKPEGCPDQGEWLLDMKNDTVTRVPKN
jgi:hypothetical protein